jgi:ferredoxin
LLLELNTRSVEWRSKLWRFDNIGSFHANRRFERHLVNLDGVFSHFQPRYNRNRFSEPFYYYQSIEETDMEGKQLFYQLNRCTGCQLCVMACALAREGVCGEKEALIIILMHPQFGTAQPLIDQACIWEECDGRCVQVCSPGVLHLAESQDWGKLMANHDWNPVPVRVQEEKS